MIERPMPRQSRRVGIKSRVRCRVHSAYRTKHTPLITKIHAKKKCHARPMDNHCGPGIVAHAGNPRTVAWPFTFDTPNQPVESKRCEPSCVTPCSFPSRLCVAPRLSHGCSKVERWPQYSAGCALKICKPLPSRINRQIALIQC